MAAKPLILLGSPGTAASFQTFLQGWGAEIRQAGIRYSQWQGWFEEAKQRGSTVDVRAAGGGRGGALTSRGTGPDKKLKSSPNTDVGEHVVFWWLAHSLQMASCSPRD